MPRPNRSGLTAAIVDSLMKTEKKTVSQIAKEYGVSVAYVSYLRRNFGKYRTRKERALDALPWDDVSPQHKRSQVFENLRNHLYYVAVGPKDMSERQLKRLGTWYDRLEGYVVVRDPDQGPSFDDAYGGWRYADRTPRDGDLILREDENTKINDADRMLWRIPAIRPN